jgi:alpha-glucosidase
MADWDADEMRAAIDRPAAALAAVGAVPTWVLSNHDVVRHVTRYGGGEIGLRRARAAALLMLGLPGGAYLYQGEELGLPEVTDLPDEARQDPAFARSGGKYGRRDGSRVPLPWSGTEPPFGFGPGTDQPWLPQPEAWAGLSVERQEADPGSTLHLYRAALALRHELTGADDSGLKWVETDPEVLCFRRGDGFACLVNFGDRAVAPPPEVADDEVVLASGPLAGDGKVPGSTAVWYRR